MRVVYGCDDNYTSLTTISAVSVLMYNPEAEIILLGCNLKDESINVENPYKNYIQRVGLSPAIFTLSFLSYDV